MSLEIRAKPLESNLRVEVSINFLAQMAAAIWLLQGQVKSVEDILVAKGLAERPEEDDSGGT